jgi:hypothetical protein
MSRTAARVTQADLARALRAVEQVAPGRMMVELTREGTIRIVTKPSGTEIEDCVKPQLEGATCSK